MASVGDTRTATGVGLLRESSALRGNLCPSRVYTGDLTPPPLEDPSLPSYTGKVTIWGGFNANGATVNGTFTFNLRATGSDGSTINTHQVDHFNQRPDGTVNEFFHCH
jgi:hypothetical protein